jgi:hypothetical protein
MQRQYDTSFQQTPAQKRWGLEQQRRHDEFNRHKNNLFEFWRVCTKAPCRRAHACKGEAESCFRHHWAMMPQDFKDWFRGVVRARAEGLSPEEANRAGEAEVQRCKELEEKYAHRNASRSEVSPQFTTRPDGSLAQRPIHDSDQEDKGPGDFEREISSR